jgi:hypothetical protein
MKKTLSLIVIACMSITACKKSELSAGPESEISTSVNTSTSNNGSEVSQDIPVNDIFYNECCDEGVLVTGMAHMVINKNIMHLNVTEITGTGLTTGFNYTSTTPSVYTNIFYSNPNEGILSFMLNLSNEDGCGFRLKLNFRLNVTPNGDVVVDFQHVESFCD